MAFPLNEYTYEPLPPQTRDAIRLLTIDPADKEAPLTGHFSVASLRANPPYEALSYVWSDPEKPEFLYTPEGYIRITRSLHAALKRIRQYEPPDEEDKRLKLESEEPPRRAPATVWAGTVCIDQEDSTEKAHQIRLMGRIFSNASLVWAYLGDKTNDGFNFSKVLDVLKSGQWSFEYLGRYDSDLRSIFVLDYFSRVWIIQEFVVAKRVVFVWGHIYVDSSHFVRLANDLFQPRFNYIMESPRKAIHRARAFFQLRSDYIEEGRRWPLVRILSHFRGRACARARDHLFALLPLADDASNPELDPNYDEPIEQTVRRYAEVFIKNGYMMELLSLAGHDPDPMECLRFPSWIPDWTSDLRAATECVGISRDCCQIGIDQTSCKVVGNILQLNGCLIDEVSDVQNSGISFAAFPSYTPLERYAEVVGSLFGDICRVSGISPDLLDLFPPLHHKMHRMVQYQRSLNGSTIPTAEPNPGTSLIDLVRTLPASAYLEKLRSFCEYPELNDGCFAWLASFFIKYNSWQAYRISIGLSLSLDGYLLPDENGGCQEDTDDSSEPNSDLDDLSTYYTFLKGIVSQTDKRFVTWAKKRLKNLTKEEKFQFFEKLNVSETERFFFRRVEISFSWKFYPVLLLLLHTFRVWRVFRTKRGKIGIGPLRIKVGDQLYSTKASKKPMVVRNVESEEGLYRFVAVAEMSSKEFEGDDDRNEVLRIC